jgi:hypothetical protein
MYHTKKAQRGEKKLASTQQQQHNMRHGDKLAKNNKPLFPQQLDDPPFLHIYESHYYTPLKPVVVFVGLQWDLNPSFQRSKIELIELFV